MAERRKVNARKSLFGAPPKDASNTEPLGLRGPVTLFKTDSAPNVRIDKDMK